MVCTDVTVLVPSVLPEKKYIIILKHEKTIRTKQKINKQPNNRLHRDRCARKAHEKKKKRQRKGKIHPTNIKQTKNIT